ncbi:MAG: phenol hydroxylase [Gammaproteobacteria bacterium]|nr:phenol hydroxylase [Gammaproteobacteria bacterium]
MSVEIKTASIEPVRLTFDHLEARIGKGKAATRYQEAVHDLQVTQNFHYRPTWDPEFDLFDKRRSAIVLGDFDQLLDPRQYYYAPYTIQRARQQEAQDGNFGIVEKRNLFSALSPEWLTNIETLIIPLRHFEWGANTNNCYIAATGYGAPFTSTALMQAMDRLGVAQYLTRLALVLQHQDPQCLDRAKALWLDDPLWQPLRQLVEDAMVTKDWFELHVLQNFLLDGAIYPFAYTQFDQAITTHGGIAYALTTEFMRDWYTESVRWTDSTIRVAANESQENKATIQTWIARWEPRVRAAVTPLAVAAFASQATGVLDSIFTDLAARRVKLGLMV